MGNSTLDDKSMTNIFENDNVKSYTPGRPDVFPCTDCGRYFTVLAMTVHKRTCTENESCECSVCKSDIKKIKPGNKKSNETSCSLKMRLSKFDENLTETHLLNGKIHGRKKTVNKDSSVKFADESSCIKSAVSENNVSLKHINKSSCIKSAVSENNVSLKLINKSSCVKSAVKQDSSSLKLRNESSYIKSPVSGNSSSSKFVDKSSCIKSAECEKDSNAQANEKLALRDHEYVSFKTESLENMDTSDSSNSSMKTCTSTKSKLKVDHDCDRKLFCRYCNYHFYWESFGLHIIEHCDVLEDKRLKCPECCRTFAQPALYLTHYLIHNSDHSVFCTDCQCSYDLCIFTERTAEPNFADNYPHHCYICLSHFSHPQTVINHMRLHSKEMPFKCSVCNRTFRQIGNLQRHMTTHRGDRPYKCPNCPSSFADPATLRNHERVHTGETPYVCPLCNRGFSQVGNLKRHMPLHLSTISAPNEISADQNDSPVLKSQDDGNITSLNNQSTSYHVNIYELNNDMKLDKKVNCKSNKKNGSLKVFTCQICKKVYAWQHDLVVHYRTHTGEKPYECEICGKRFAQSGAIRTHKFRHHENSGILKKQTL